MKLNIVSADDSAITLKKLIILLEGLGHRVVATAATGAEAVEAYRRHRPDLLTLDITMPDMTGVEATARIVAEFPDARIMMVTSHGQERMVIASLEAGAKGYVLKPVRMDKLSDMIARILDQSEPGPDS